MLLLYTSTAALASVMFMHIHCDCGSAYHSVSLCLLPLNAVRIQGCSFRSRFLLDPPSLTEFRISDGAAHICIFRGLVSTPFEI